MWTRVGFCGVGERLRRGDLDALRLRERVLDGDFLRASRLPGPSFSELRRSFLVRGSFFPLVAFEVRLFERDLRRLRLLAVLLADEELLDELDEDELELAELELLSLELKSDDFQYRFREFRI
jgi:hypothetical protein